MAFFCSSLSGAGEKTGVPLFHVFGVVPLPQTARDPAIKPCLDLIFPVRSVNFRKIPPKVILILRGKEQRREPVKKIREGVVHRMGNESPWMSQRISELNN